MGDLVRRVGGVAMTREAESAITRVSDVEQVEVAVMRSKARVVDGAISIVSYLKMRQKEEEQRNPDAAEFVAALVNRRCLGVRYDAEQYELWLSWR